MTALPDMHRLTIACASQSEAAERADLLETIDGAFATGWQETDEQLGLFEAEAYFHEKPTPAALAPLGDAAITLAAVAERDWVAQSLQQFQPVRAGRFFVHGSHHDARTAPGALSIRIDAGLAFGTGHHETTMGCLVALDRLLKARRPRRALDLGCGTGILAIAAAKALRLPVVASDIDPVAVAVARDNARTNAVAGFVRPVVAAGFAHAGLSAGPSFDLIIANILANPLMELATPLAARLAGGGSAILSGLLAHQAPRVAARYRAAGLALGRTDVFGEWAVLIMHKP